MHTLYSFYRSKEWERLLKIMKQNPDRQDADGNIICARCGKPIVRAYDMIGHHKIELTDENVNDYSISLNPENIEFLHHRCHNLVHDRFGYQKTRQVFLVYGAPLSGKTTWVNENRMPGDLIIDMDSIWQCISGEPRYIKPNRLKNIAFRVRDTLIDSVKYRAGKWFNAYVIGGYAMQAERERLCDELQAREIFIECSKGECLNRLEHDDKRNHDEWREYIERWFELNEDTPLS